LKVNILQPKCRFARSPFVVLIEAHISEIGVLVYLDENALLHKRRDLKGIKIMKTRSKLQRLPRLSAGVILIMAILARPVAAQYPALTEYLLPRDGEMALAKSAAPANISDRATIKVLTKSGYEVAHKGNNGFVCMVMRGWAAPTYTPPQFRNLVYDASVRAPICFDPVASRTVMPYYELRSKLGMEGKTPDQIAEGVQAAYVKGQLPKRDAVSFAYMWSADMELGPGVGHWHPHMMIFAPYYENAMLGGNEFGKALPQVSDDAGTPFTVIVIPVDHSLAIKARPN
jgi:hypothetical protein